ncbi:hypothetical protein HCJ93_23725 [Streptomyces sp. SBST2-5]|uniref:Uncharacterized protein n=1 Tax=Streptomyces composti TaxID=2720025 RepID=A0ABX1ACU2_9ACTN|nr:DUF6214 family protein [Streptomyces composti]NJP52995.1 hypothetical protein [Streptomyces composti]
MSVCPAWEVREGSRATRWLRVRLAFADGAGVEALAVVGEGDVRVEEVRAGPGLSLEDLAELAHWIEAPLARACGAGPEDGTGAHRGRRIRPTGPEGRRLVAREYRAAQLAGTDPVLAVMGATGCSRRGALRLIGRARDAGLLTPRHARRRAAAPDR